MTDHAYKLKTNILGDKFGLQKYNIMSSRGMLCQHPVSKEDCNVLFKIYRKLDFETMLKFYCLL
jgi:hypothetical protein